uniref:Uncharacterized protein n=1 Tax=Ditylenchus dipsaci TaxID=166011 RepID=A0A915DZE2_9BILA
MLLFTENLATGEPWYEKSAKLSINYKELKIRRRQKKVEFYRKERANLERQHATKNVRTIMPKKNNAKKKQFVEVDHCIVQVRKKVTQKGF